MRARTLALTLASTTLFALGLGGCGDELDPAWDVKTFRVFGARVDNITRGTSMSAPDPRAAEVAPGETVRLTLSYIDPQPSRALTAVWIFCPQTMRSGNTFGCAPTADLPPQSGTTVTFTVPRSIAFGVDPLGRSRIQAIAFACAGGTIGFNANSRLPACNGDGAESITMTRSIIIRTAETAEMNHNPELTEVIFYPLGNGQTPVTLMPGDASYRVPRCTTDPCPDHLLELRVSATSRETYTTLDIRGQRVMQPERLQFGFYMMPPLAAPLPAAQQRARGRFDGTFFVDTAERPMGPVRKKWQAPTTPGPVTFVFNASDVRGGYDAIQRALTVE